ALPIDTCREMVELGDLRRRVRQARSARGMRVLWRFNNTYMRTSLRSIIETKHAFDNGGKLLGDMHRPRAAPMATSWMLVAGQIHPKCVTQICDCPREHYTALCHIDLHDIEAVLMRENFDLLEVRRIGTMGGSEFCAAEI